MVIICRYFLFIDPLISIYISNISIFRTIETIAIVKILLPILLLLPLLLSQTITNYHDIYFFFFWFGFYGPFKNISLISSQLFIKGGQKLEKTGEPRENHLTIHTQTLAFPHVTRTWLSHMWPERGLSHSSEKPTGLRVLSTRLRGPTTIMIALLPRSFLRCILLHPYFQNDPSEVSHQTVQMCRLIWIFAWCTFSDVVAQTVL